MSEEQQYKRGFNQGYLIRKHRSGLDVFSQITENDPYSSGLLDGRSQFEQEHKRQQLREQYFDEKSQERGRSRG